MIPILYSDDDCVVVMKSAGMAAIPEVRGDPQCLSAHVSVQLGRPVMPVHRLDKEVSGLILFALTREAHRFLNIAFERREVKKTYLALLHGTVEGEQRMMTHAIRAFGSGRMGVDAIRGKPSETRLHVLDRVAGHTLVHLYPFTGRRHQLRVHCHAIGHPIVGDLKYGMNVEQQGYPRLMLTATGLSLTLPSGRELTLSDQVPEDFSHALSICLHLAD